MQGNILNNLLALKIIDETLNGMLVYDNLLFTHQTVIIQAYLTLLYIIQQRILFNIDDLSRILIKLKHE